MTDLHLSWCPVTAKLDFYYYVAFISRDYWRLNEKSVEMGLENSPKDRVAGGDRRFRIFHLEHYA